MLAIITSVSFPKLPSLSIGFFVSILLLPSPDQTSSPQLHFETPYQVLPDLPEKFKLTSSSLSLLPILGAETPAI